MAVVYQHIRKDNNEVFYVGIGLTEKRAFSKKNRNKYWHNIVNKCGYCVEIIYNTLTWDLASNVEKNLVSFYGRKDLKLGELVNLTNGGDGTSGIKVSEETRLKLSFVAKGKKPSEKTISAAKKARLGLKFSDEWRKNLSISHKKYKPTDKHRENLSLAKKERDRKQFNFPILQYDTQGNFIKEWPCKEDIVNILNIKKGNINSVLNGIRKQTHGFIFKKK